MVNQRITSLILHLLYHGGWRFFLKFIMEMGGGGVGGGAGGLKIK